MQISSFPTGVWQSLWSDDPDPSGSCVRVYGRTAEQLRPWRCRIFTTMLNVNHAAFTASRMGLRGA